MFHCANGIVKCGYKVEKKKFSNSKSHAIVDSKVLNFSQKNITGGYCSLSLKSITTIKNEILFV